MAAISHLINRFEFGKHLRGRLGSGTRP
jgi:hypothetical protein